MVGEADFSDLNVLLVDDEPNTRDILKQFLIELGVDAIHEAAAAQEAIDHLTSNGTWTGIILCDWNMPAMTGAAFYLWLKKNRPDIPFIMISGRNDEDSILFARDNGITSYLLKPIPLEELATKLSVVACKAQNILASGRSVLYAPLA